MTKLVFIDDIDIKGSPMVRDHLDEGVAADYAEIYKANKKELPPIELFTPDGKIAYIGDGLHRLHGMILLKQKTIIANVRKGGYEEALKFALTANKKHGLRRTLADRKRCVVECIKQWPKYSDRMVSDMCAVDHKTVTAIRGELEGSGAVKSEPLRESADGKTRPAAKPKEEGEEKPAEKKQQRLSDKDSVGFVIPAQALPYWHRTPEVKEIIANMSSLSSFLKDVQLREDAMYGEVNLSAAMADLDKLITNLGSAIPYAVCTQCQGQPSAQSGGCRLCKGRGLISKFMWNRVPESVRKMREAAK